MNASFFTSILSLNESLAPTTRRWPKHLSPPEKRRKPDPEKVEADRQKLRELGEREEEEGESEAAEAEVEAREAGEEATIDEQVLKVVITTTP
ncbi:MAG: hypothetical protein M1835_005601 [Candelina submexicana]|nr:MAG: hypothetical protein M1835_005601 [Candelina submexicana]